MESWFGVPQYREHHVYPEAKARRSEPEIPIVAHRESWLCPGVSGLGRSGVGRWLLLAEARSKPDAVAAAHANARGIGHMEQFDYPAALKEFEESVKFAPDWTPAKINLGIALLNTQVRANLDRALKLFDEIIAQDPDNVHAQYCSGIILYYNTKLPEAGKRFEAVNRIDPNDAQAWYWRGKCIADSSESEEALKLFEKALKLNPYLNAARYSVAQHRILADDEKRKKQLLDEFSTLGRANSHDLLDIKYTEMGRYGEVIGKSPAARPETGILPMFEAGKGAITLAQGTKWADEKSRAADKEQGVDTIRSIHRGAMLVLDYNRDGKPDVLLLSAVTDGTKLRDLLLRNDGNGAFTDVTAEAGLANHPGSLGGAVGDYDNDGFADVALAGPDGLKLFRNNAGKSFEDKSEIAGFKKVDGVFLTATWVDLDQDGDIDLVAARTGKDAGIVVHLNVGVAPPTAPSQPMPPLTTAFKLATEPEALLVKGPVTGIVATDVDGDFDTDLLVLVAGRPPITVLNDRLLRFHHGDAVTLAGVHWLGGLVVDANGDDQSDIVLIDLTAARESTSARRTRRRRRSARASSPAGPTRLRSGPRRGATSISTATPTLSASRSREGRLPSRDGTGKFAENEPFGPQAEAISDLPRSPRPIVDGDGNLTSCAVGSCSGLRVFRSIGNGNRGLRLILTGRRMGVAPGDESKPLRTNADAVGSWVRVHAGPVRSAAENTTLFGGLGQSRPPLHFGIGKADAADVVRMRWPDAVVQAEMNQAAGLVAIAELNRKPSSCPILFTWDGERFVYITDFLGAGSVGECGPDGSVRPPRPEESVKIEPGRLAPKNGKLIVKIGEPMDEVMYLDRLRLDAIDHPAGTSVFPDERFATSDPQPTQQRLFFRDSERVFPTKAVDHRGRDVTETLREPRRQHAGWLRPAVAGFWRITSSNFQHAIKPSRKAPGCTAVTD